MKKLILLLFIPLISFSSFGQDSDRYVIYPTQNMYNFLSLNTATGQIEQVQWSTDNDTRFTTNLSMKVLLPEDIDWQDYEVFKTLPAGRFKLYPTTNKYNFILQDATDGRIWQVQWGLDTADRQVIRIMNWQSDDF